MVNAITHRQRRGLSWAEAAPRSADRAAKTSCRFSALRTAGLSLESRKKEVEKRSYWGLLSDNASKQQRGR
jgi:hypothetical protein